MKVFNWKFYAMIGSVIVFTIRDVHAVQVATQVDSPTYSVVSAVLGSLVIGFGTWWASTVNKSLNQFRRVMTQLADRYNLEHPDTKIEIGD